MQRQRRNGVPNIFSAIILFCLICIGPTLQIANAEGLEIGFFSDDFSTDSGSWNYFGNAHRDPTNQTLVLTSGDMSQGGAAFFNAPIQGSFSASFRYKVGEGWCQGDGFTIFFYKQHYSAIDKGGSQGFNIREGQVLKAVPGYGIEFDGWQNIVYDFQQVQGAQQNPQGDPNSNHIALIKDFSGNHLAWVNDSRVADNIWHSATVSVDASSVKVYVDKQMVLEWSGTFNRTFDGFGFSGGTGEPGSNWHIIDDFTITANDLQVPILTTSCISSATTSSFNVHVIGDLTFNGAPIPEAPILLSYSVTGGETWQELTLLHTDSDGSYSALWLLPVTGDYMLKAVYPGDYQYLGANNVVSFCILPCALQSVFSVTSNSTLSELSFDSAGKKLSFKVTGDSDTTGYVEVCIPNSLINDTDGLTVSLDNSQVSYTVEKVSEGWLIRSSYHHSTHIITVNLGENVDSKQTTTPTTQVFGIVEIGILMFMSALASAAVTLTAVFLKKNRSKN